LILDGSMLMVRYTLTEYPTCNLHYQAEVQFQEAKTKVSSTDLSDTYSKNTFFG